MQPLQITFRNVPPSRTIERLVREKTQHLEKSCDGIVKCHVTLQSQHQGHRGGNLYDVRLDIQIPGKTFAVTSARHDNREHELLSAAVRDAFDAAERQLHDYTAAHRGREQGRGRRVRIARARIGRRRSVDAAGPRAGSDNREL